MRPNTSSVDLVRILKKGVPTVDKETELEEELQNCVVKFFQYAQEIRRVRGSAIQVNDNRRAVIPARVHT